MQNRIKIAIVLASLGLMTSAFAADDQAQEDSSSGNATLSTADQVFTSNQPINQAQDDDQEMD